jgi:hypothetical protein
MTLVTSVWANSGFNKSGQLAVCPWLRPRLLRGLAPCLGTGGTPEGLIRGTAGAHRRRLSGTGPDHLVVLVDEEPDPVRVEIGRDRFNGGCDDLGAVSPRQNLLHRGLRIEPHQGRRELVTLPEPRLELLGRFHDAILACATTA